MIADITSAICPRHRTSAELAAGLAEIRGAPKDQGKLELIVARPVSDQRLILQQADLRPADGLVGDRWLAKCEARLADGSPDPAVQITLMNARCIQLLTGD